MEYVFDDTDMYLIFSNRPTLVSASPWTAS
jgi:hypothetical protein